MALSNELGQVDITPENIDANAVVQLEQHDGVVVLTKSVINMITDLAMLRTSIFKPRFQMRRQIAQFPMPRVLR